jgi:hypothetical protein
MSLRVETVLEGQRCECRDSLRLLISIHVVIYRTGSGICITVYNTLPFDAYTISMGVSSRCASSSVSTFGNCWNAYRVRSRFPYMETSLPYLLGSRVLDSTDVYSVYEVVLCSYLILYDKGRDGSSFNQRFVRRWIPYRAAFMGLHTVLRQALIRAVLNDIDHIWRSLRVGLDEPRHLISLNGT